MIQFFHGYAGWWVRLSFLFVVWISPPVWAQSRPGGASDITNRFILSPASSHTEIELQLKSMREQEDALHREERVLQADIQRIDEGVQQYLSATNSIDDPDILAFMKQLDELESKHRALNSALASKLQELPQFKGHFEMKRAAYYRLQQIEKKLGELQMGQKLLHDRIDVLVPSGENSMRSPSLP